MVVKINGIFEDTEAVNLADLETVGTGQTVKYPEIQEVLRKLPELDPGIATLPKGGYAIFPKVESESGSAMRLPTRQISTAAAQAFGARYADKAIMTKKAMRNGEQVVFVWRVKVPTEAAPAT